MRSKRYTARFQARCLALMNTVYNGQHKSLGSFCFGKVKLCCSVTALVHSIHVRKRPCYCNKLIAVYIACKECDMFRHNYPPKND